MLIGKAVAYVLFFLVAGHLLHLGKSWRALVAGVHRFWLGVLSIFPMMGLLAIAQGDHGVNEGLATAFFWIIRCGTWWLSYVMAYPAPRATAWKQVVLVVAGLLLNVAIDLLVFGYPGGRGGASPSFGNWNFGL